MPANGSTKALSQRVVAIYRELGAVDLCCTIFGLYESILIAEQS